MILPGAEKTQSAGSGCAEAAAPAVSPPPCRPRRLGPAELERKNFRFLYDYRDLITLYFNGEINDKCLFE